MGFKVNEFIDTGGGRSRYAKFEFAGASYTGVVLGCEWRTDEYGEAGGQVLVMTLQTSDGPTGVFMRSEQMREALGAAVRSSGSEEVEDGATVSITYERLLGRMKFYKVTYAPPGGGKPAWLGPAPSDVPPGYRDFSEPIHGGN